MEKGFTYIRRRRPTAQRPGGQKESGRRLADKLLIIHLSTNRCAPLSISIYIGFVLFVLFPGHALQEKGLQRQKGVGPLVSSQDERALLVPVINRLSTADFVPPSVYIGFRLFVLLERRPRNVSSMFWRVRMRLVP